MNILEQFGVDPSRYYLGQPCKRSHIWNDTGKSLRRKKGKACIECSKICCKERWQKVKSDPDLQSRINAYTRKYQRQRRQSDPEWAESERIRLRVYEENNKDLLGERRRAYAEANREKLRERARANYEVNRDAINQKKRELWAANPEKHREYGRRYRAKNLEACREMCRNRMRIRLQQDRDGLNARRRETYAKNPEPYKAICRRYQKANPDVFRKKNQRRKYNRIGAHKAPYGTIELLSRLSQFEGCCAYCGDPHRQWDHFIPINNGGADVVGNLIPSCQSCNSSKQDSDPYDWYKKQEFFKRSQWLKILKVLGKTEKTYNQIPLL
jgi:hypothetical protein